MQPTVITERERRTRKCKTLKLQSLLSKGNKVEVKSDEEGFRGVWYESTIVEVVMSRSGKKKGQVLVQYDTLFEDEDGTTPLKEYVSPTFVRPLPPKQDGDVSHCFEVYDVVDAYYQDGWWIGVVSGVREVDGVNKYMVVFENPPHQIEFGAAELRVHWDWIGEEWVRPPKERRIKGLVYSKGMTVEVNPSKGRPKYVWYQAVILEEEGYNSFVVMIGGKGNSNECRKRILVVDSFHVRPPYPIFKTKEFDLLEKVCVFHGSARKEGFIADILTDGRFDVYLKGEQLTKKFTRSKLMPYLQFINGKWIGRRCKDGSRISSCQGHDNILVNSKKRSPVVTIQLDSASSENTQLLEQNPCTKQPSFSITSNSQFKKARSKVSQRKTSNSQLICLFTPPTPIEQSKGENSTSCMLAKCLSNPVAEKNLSVKSTIPGSTEETHEEEGIMEDNMMAFSKNSEAPQNLEPEVQQVSVSGKMVNPKDVCLETLAPPSSIDHMEIDCLLNTCGTKSVDQPQLSHLEGGEDNEKGFLGETLASQSSTDCLINTHGTEFVDQPRFLHSEGGVDNGKGVLVEMLSPLAATDCMAKEVNKDASLVSSCQRKSDDLVENKESKTDAAIEHESASGLNNQVQEKSLSANSCENASNYSAAVNSEFINSKRRACESKAESSSPCKKSRGEKYATCSSSECHEKPTTIEEEATMEAGMMTSVDKSGVPENSELKSQQISASGEKDNRKGVSEEVLTPQFSADFTAGVNMVDVGTNHLVKSGDMLMDDQCQCSEETSAPLATTPYMKKTVTGDVVAECISESCGISNVDQQSQLCLEGGTSNGKIMSAESSEPFSATDCLTKEVDIVDIATDCAENSNRTSGVHQPQFLSLEGYSPCNTQNQCNGAIDRQSVLGIESPPVRSVEVSDEPVENVEFPFIKNPHHWKIVDSLEIFKLLPQKPHFRPLVNFSEAFREGLAIGYMVTFSNVVEKISKLQLTDSLNKFEKVLQTLAELEMHGFRVKPLVDRVNMLLSMKDQLRRLEDQSEDVKTQLANRISEQKRLHASTLAIEKMLSELKKELRLHVLLEKNSNRDITNLQRDGNSINEGISAIIHNFEILIASSW